MNSSKPISIGYETCTAEEWDSVDAISRAYQAFGFPQSPFSESGRKVVETIINVWEVVRPDEAYRWKRERDAYQSSEMDIHQQVKKQTGRTLASYPSFIFMIFKKVFPECKFKREDHIKFAQLWPIFRYANKI